MKFNIGDLVKFNKFRPRPRPRPRLLLRPRPLLRHRLYHHLINTYGIIMRTEKHNEIFEKDSTDDDNGYVWLSQIEQKEYYFYENEAAATNISAI